MIDLYNGDYIDKLKTIKDGTIDLIATDPPYRITARGTSSTTMGGYMTNEMSRKGLIFENNDVDCKDFFREFYRVLKEDAHCYVMCNNINLIEYLNEGVNAGFHFVKSLIWNKGNKICGRYYMNCFEYILFFRKGKDKPINDCGQGDILSIPIYKLKNEDGTNKHDTEKPVDLMKVLIGNSTNKGELVLDPFMGIGSCGVASKELGRDFIGCEINPKFFNICKERIEECYEVTPIEKWSLLDDLL